MIVPAFVEFPCFLDESQEGKSEITTRTDFVFYYSLVGNLSQELHLVVTDAYTSWQTEKLGIEGAEINLTKVA